MPNRIDDTDRSIRELNCAHNADHNISSRRPGPVPSGTGSVMLTPVDNRLPSWQMASVDCATERGLA